MESALGPKADEKKKETEDQIEVLLYGIKSNNNKFIAFLSHMDEWGREPYGDHLDSFRSRYKGSVTFLKDINKNIPWVLQKQKVLVNSLIAEMEEGVLHL